MRNLESRDSIESADAADPPVPGVPRPRPGRSYSAAQGLGFQTGLTYISGMLRLRKMPPAGLETINSGEPWSAMDMADLEEFLTEGQQVTDIANYLCRTVEEVEAKIALLRN